MKKHEKKCLALTALLLSLLLLLTACGLPQKEEEEETKRSTRKTTEAQTEEAATTEAPTTEAPTIPPTPSEELLNEVQKGNYVKALDIYGNSIAGNSREEVSAQTLLDSYLKDNWQSYYDGTLPESEMKIVLTTLQKINDRYYILNDLSDYQTYFAEISLSRANYEKGEKLAEEGKYMEAAEAFEQVDPVDSVNYVSAQEKAQEVRMKYKNDIMDKARALVEDKKYSDAFNLVLDAQFMYFYNDPEMTDYLLEINTLLVAEDMQKAFDAKNYVEVINRYEHALTADWGIKPTADITELYTISKTTFIDRVEKEALAAFGTERDYEAATEVLRNAIDAAVSNDGLVSTLEEMINEYRAYIPIPITSLKPTQVSDYILIGKDYDQRNNPDVNGNAYTVDYLIGLLRRSSHPEKEEGEYVTYNLNYQYGILSTVVFRPYSSLSCKSTWTKPGYVRIYGDDVLLFESKPITQDVYDNQIVSLDVSGVRNLKIVLVGYWHLDNSSSYFGKVSLGDTMLQKRIADKHIVTSDIIITEQPNDITAAADSNVIFTISAAGKNLTYRWEYSKDGGKKWGNWGSDTPDCEVEAYARRNGYLFRCVVTNDKNESITSDIVKLNVK